MTAQAVISTLIALIKAQLEKLSNKTKAISEIRYFKNYIRYLLYYMTSVRYLVYNMVFKTA